MQETLDGALPHEAPRARGAHAHAPQAFIWRYVFSKDHKVIGIQYYVAAMVMALVAGLLAMLIRVQLGLAGEGLHRLGKLLPAGLRRGGGLGGVMQPEFYAMLFTMHGTIMVFFVLSTAPVSGFGNILIPLQAGARDMAFPFLNGLSFWTFLPGLRGDPGVLLRGAGAAAAGWTSYPAAVGAEGSGARLGDWARRCGSSAWCSSSPRSPWAASTSSPPS